MGSAYLSSPCSRPASIRVSSREDYIAKAESFFFSLLWEPSSCCFGWSDAAKRKNLESGRQESSPAEFSEGERLAMSQVKRHGSRRSADVEQGDCSLHFVMTCL